MRMLVLAFSAIVAASCTGAASPHNGIVQVTNQEPDNASFAWTSPGLFGNMVLPDTGQDVIEGCSTYTRSFGPGPSAITIWHGKQTLNLALSLTKNDEQRRYVLIDKSGAVSEVDASRVPTRPCS